MDKQTYFIEALKNKAFLKFKWIQMVFMEYNPPPAYIHKPYDLQKNDTQYFFIDLNETTHIITDGDPDSPLFGFKDPITLEANTFINQPDKITTTYFNTFWNAYTAIYALKGKVPFYLGKINLNKIEQQMTPLLVPNKEGYTEKFDPDTDNYPKQIPIADLNMWKTCCGILESLGKYAVSSATKKNTVPPKGIEAFRNSLRKEFGENPTELEQAEINRRLVAFDKEWLAGDPSLGGVMSGSVLDVARIKIHGFQGSETNFNEKLESVYNMKPLTEGPPTDPERLATSMSSIRFGSYARGVMTAISGVMANTLMNILVDVEITKEDCGTKRTRKEIVRKREVDTLIGRYVKAGSGWRPLTREELQQGEGQTFQVRSIGFCLLPKDEVCKHCAGERANLSKKGLGLLGAELGSTMMRSMFMLMKNVKKTSAVTEWDRISR